MVINWEQYAYGQALVKINELDAFDDSDDIDEFNDYDAVYYFEDYVDSDDSDVTNLTTSMFLETSQPLSLYCFSSSGYGWRPPWGQNARANFLVQLDCR